MFNRLKSIGRRMGREIGFLKTVAAHPRTPVISRVLVLLAVAYLASPLDLIPDWIPVLGQIDDLVLVPVLVLVALALIPREVRKECRQSPVECSTEDRE